MLYTKTQVIESLKARYRLMNYGLKDKAILIAGLTMDQIEVIGDVDLALPESSKTGSRVKSSYPSPLMSA